MILRTAIGITAIVIIMMIIALPIYLQFADDLVYKKMTKVNDLNFKFTSSV